MNFLKEGEEMEEDPFKALVSIKHSTPHAAPNTSQSLQAPIPSKKPLIRATNASQESLREAEPLMVVRDIGKNFRKHIALEHISFSLPENAVFGIIGPNGAGKSTLLKILIGFLDATSGEIILEGKTLSKNRSVDMRHLFGYASQNNCFYNELTVIENLTYFGRLYWLTEKEIAVRIKELISLVGLLEHESIPAGHLSGGMQRKLDIACAIIHAPKILVLDEPTGGLDPISAKHLWQILDHINAIGTTIIIASHNLHDIEEKCSHLLILNEGKVVRSGAIAEMKQKNHQSIIFSMRPFVFDFVPTLTGVVHWSRKKDVIELSSSAPEQTITSLLQELNARNIVLTKIAMLDTPLSDIFESLIFKNKPLNNVDIGRIERLIKEHMQHEYVKIRHSLEEKNFDKNTIEKILRESKR